MQNSGVIIVSRACKGYKGKVLEQATQQALILKKRRRNRVITQSLYIKCIFPLEKKKKKLCFNIKAACVS